MAAVKYSCVEAMARDIAVLEKHGIRWEAYSATEPADGLADAYEIIVVTAIEVIR